MLSRIAEAALVNIRFNIVLIDDFLRGLNVEAFGRDLKSLYATVRALEIISEASRRLPDDLKARHPEISWQEVKSAGNVYRHDYEDVIPALVWETATRRLLPLLAVVDAELAHADRGSI